MNYQPIFICILQNDEEALEILLKFSSVQDLKDIELARTSTGLSPLALAVILKNWKIAEVLANQYPRLINLEDSENLTPLLRSILLAEFSFAMTLIDDLKGDINHVNRKGYNIMHLSIFLKNVEVINFLIGKKFDPHKEEY